MKYHRLLHRSTRRSVLPQLSEQHSAHGQQRQTHRSQPLWIHGLIAKDIALIPKVTKENKASAIWCLKLLYRSLSFHGKMFKVLQTKELEKSLLSVHVLRAYV